MSFEGLTKQEVKKRLLEEMPEQCDRCPVLGRCAVRYARLRAQDELTPYERRKLRRLMFSRVANLCKDGTTSDGECGSSAYS